MSDVKSKYWRIEAVRAIAGAQIGFSVEGPGMSTEIFRKELSFPEPLSEPQVLTYVGNAESTPWYVVSTCALRSWKAIYNYQGGSGRTVFLMPMSVSDSFAKDQIREWVEYKWTTVRKQGGFELLSVEANGD